MFDLLLKLAKLMHQIRDLGNSIIMNENSIASTSAILVLVFFMITLTLVALASDQGIEQALNISVVCDIKG